MTTKLNAECALGHLFGMSERRARGNRPAAVFIRARSGQRHSIFCRLFHARHLALCAALIRLRAEADSLLFTW
jgi:hypothetical protein